MSIVNTDSEEFKKLDENLINDIFEIIHNDIGIHLVSIEYEQDQIKKLNIEVQTILPKDFINIDVCIK